MPLVEANTNPADGIPLRALLDATTRLARHPGLWETALFELMGAARPGWWRHWPPLPLPDPRYVRFRIHTAYGGDRSEPAPADVVDFLQWCRRMRQLAR